MATNNNSNPYGFTPPQPGFDPQAFAETLYGKMGAKRAVAPMQPQTPAQAPAQPDLYAQPQRPIKTPFQEQMDRERAARSAREQARATFYQNPANFRYGARQDPNQVAQFDAANQRAIAAERLAADAARARQTVDQGRLVSTDVGAATAESERMAAIERSKENLRRAAANEQQVRDQQSAEAAKMRAEEDRVLQIQRRLQEAIARKAELENTGTEAEIRKVGAEVASLEDRLAESRATSGSRVAAANATNEATKRRVGAEADAAEIEAAIKRRDLAFRETPEGAEYERLMRQSAVEEARARANKLRAEGSLSEAQRIQIENQAKETVAEEANKLPAEVRNQVLSLAPEGVDLSKTPLGLVASNLSGVDLSETDKLAVESLLPQLSQIETAMQAMPEAQRAQVRNTVLSMMRSLDISDPTAFGYFWEGLWNPIDTWSVTDEYASTRAKIIEKLRSIVRPSQPSGQYNTTVGKPLPPE